MVISKFSDSFGPKISIQVCIVWNKIQSQMQLVESNVKKVFFYFRLNKPRKLLKFSFFLQKYLNQLQKTKIQSFCFLRYKGKENLIKIKKSTGSKESVEDNKQKQTVLFDALDQLFTLNLHLLGCRQLIKSQLTL